MKILYSNVNGVVIGFDCIKCGEPIATDVSIPEANILGDNVSESENSDEDEVQCNNCGHSYYVRAYSNMYEKNIELKDEDGKDIDFEIEESN